MQQNNESLFMTSVEKARIRNETLLKVKISFLIFISVKIIFYFLVNSKIKS